MTAVICTLKASTGKVTFLLQHLTNSNILPPGPICTASRKNTKLIVSTDSSWKDFSIAVFFLLLTLQNIMLQHTIDRQPMLTGSMGQNNKSFLKQFPTSTLTYFKLTMNTLFFQERAQGDAPTDSVCPYIVTISEAAPSVAVPVTQLAPFLFGPLKTLHSNKDMQSINQSRLSHFHP